MRFLSDMALSPHLAMELVSEGLDAVHASSRVVITADLDFPRLLASLGASGPGLIRFPRESTAEMDADMRKRQEDQNHAESF